jgi:PIN domain nuclease of toxin-antitoxin system
LKLLVDTHVLLWWLGGADELAESAADAIADPGNFVAVSAASLWEISIKRSLRKLRVEGELHEAVVSGDGFEALPISLEHADAAGQLPPHHRDPFDRMLVAQAQSEGLTVVTRDLAFEDYEIPLLTA